MFLAGVLRPEAAAMPRSGCDLEAAGVPRKRAHTLPTLEKTLGESGRLIVIQKR